MDPVVIIGSGEFARAFAYRFQQYNEQAQLIIGRREPARPVSGRFTNALENTRVAGIKESLQMGDVIIIALNPQHHNTLLPYSDQLSGKILVDVSNFGNSPDLSNAQQLAKLFPRSVIVKAFNTTSVNVMMTDSPQCDPVYICSDDITATGKISELASSMGFMPVNYGKLSRAKYLEANSRHLFYGWGWPTIVLLVLSAYWVTFTLCRHFRLREDPYTWERLPTNVINKITGAIALSMLCCVYIPGCVAAFHQMVKGSKNCDFPKFLDIWLKIRQKLGLYALMFGLIHMYLSLSLMSPQYFPKWFLKKGYHLKITPNETFEVTIPLSSRMNWIGEVCIILGVLGMISLSVLGLTTIPSVSNAFNWREWRWIHSHLGFVCLLLSGSHVTVKGASNWKNADIFLKSIPTVSFLSCLMPWITLAMRIVLYLPCISRYLRKIRHGSGDQNSTLMNNEKEQSLV